MEFDVSYLSIDSVQEGVGASQIQALLLELAKSELALNLITFEKRNPSADLINEFKGNGIVWNPLPFMDAGAIGGLKRVNNLLKEVPESKVLHCRSDLPSLAGLYSGKGPVLWDVRSLWREQRKRMNPRQVNPIIDSSLKLVENYVAANALGMNTLTSAIVPILKERHKSLPKYQSVIPTSVDLERFTYSSFPKGRIRMLISGNLNQNYDIKLLNKLILAFRTQIDLEVVWASDIPASVLDPLYDVKISVDHKDMPDLVSSCHFGVAILQKSETKSLAAAMPTKIAEFLASGRPVIISSEVGDFDEIFKARKAGLTLSPSGDLSLICEEMLNLITDQETSSICREVAENQFNLKRSATKYIELYSKLALSTEQELN